MATPGGPDSPFMGHIWNSNGNSEEARGTPRHSPERHGQDPLHLDSPLQYFLYLPFVWALFDLFSAN